MDINARVKPELLRNGLAEIDKVQASGPFNLVEYLESQFEADRIKMALANRETS
jgi:hypothetical protein